MKTADIDREVYCPGCGHRMRRGKSPRNHNWYCDNPTCDIIEFTYDRNYRNIFNIKRASKK